MSLSENVSHTIYMVAATGVLIAAVFYVMNMRATLQMRQAQLYMYFASQMTSDTWAEHMLRIRDAKWSSLDEFNKWYNENPKNPVSWGIALNYFENAGVLIRKNLMDLDLVAIGFAGMTRQFWEKVKPVVLSQRVTWSHPRFASEFEYLYNRLMKYMEEHPEFKT